VIALIISLSAQTACFEQTCYKIGGNLNKTTPGNYHIEQIYLDTSVTVGESQKMLQGKFDIINLREDSTGKLQQLHSWNKPVKYDANGSGCVRLNASDMGSLIHTHLFNEIKINK
jgi:hypothetical protein